MGGDQAASTLLEIQIQAMKRSGHEPDDQELTDLKQRVKSAYDEQTDVRYAAARLWVDRIIMPAETRNAIMLALSVSVRHDEGRAFKTGVLQV
jgi:acetyl-CoA carboxylase carboxyltransferase component